MINSSTFPFVGQSVSLSSDGSLLAVGGPSDNDDIGATWVFEYDDREKKYKQMGLKVTGNDANEFPNQAEKQSKNLLLSYMHEYLCARA